MFKTLKQYECLLSGWSSEVSSKFVFSESSVQMQHASIWPNLNWWGFLAASWLTVTSDCRRRWSQCSESFHMRSHTRKKREKSFAFMMLFCDHTTILDLPLQKYEKDWELQCGVVITQWAHQSGPSADNAPQTGQRLLQLPFPPLTFLFFLSSALLFPLQSSLHYHQGLNTLELAQASESQWDIIEGNERSLIIIPTDRKRKKKNIG